MSRSIAALVLSATPLASSLLVLLIAQLFPIVNGRRDPGAGVAMGVLVLVAIGAWPVGLGVSIFAHRRAEDPAARNTARVALALGALGGAVLFVSCALFSVLVAGLSMR